MKIRTDPHKIIVSNTRYEHRGLYAAIPGARVAKLEVATYYMPRSPITAMRLRQLALANGIVIEAADVGFNDLIVDMGRIIHEQTYKDPSTNIHARSVSTDNWWTETTPWAHQVTADLFSMDKEAAYLAMEMGTGKTIVVINEILREVRAGAKRFLILCPKSVLDVWIDEFQKHCYSEDLSSLEIIALKKGTTKDKKALCRERNEFGRKPLTIIVNYESAWRNSLGDFLLNQKWDMVICDEAHRIKSAGGKASRFCARLAKKARRRRCLSGTPLPNNQLDAYGQFRFLDVGIFGTSIARFRARYAQMGGYQGYEIVAWQNQDEFRRLLDYLTFRVDKGVLDLPPAVSTVRRCELPADTRKLYNQIERDFIADLGHEVVPMANVLKRLTKLQQLSSGFIIDDDGETMQLHHEKTKLLREFLDSVATDEKVVVFCRFVRDLEEVRSVCTATGRHYGELSGSANDLEGGRFEDPVNVLGAQIQAGGIGVNLAAARYCVFYSVGYSLADYLQAQARVHRGGQDRPVTYVNLIADDSMDERVYNALAAKKEVVDEILAYIKREKI